MPHCEVLVCRTVALGGGVPLFDQLMLVLLLPLLCMCMCISSQPCLLPSAGSDAGSSARLAVMLAVVPAVLGWQCRSGCQHDYDYDRPV